MSPELQALLTTLAGLTLEEAEQLLSSWLPAWPIEELTKLVTSVASLLDAKTRAQQVSDAEQAIIAGDDALEAPVVK